MKPSSPSLNQLALAALIATALLVASCDDAPQSADVEVKAPELASSGPTLTAQQWRKAVSGICREATEQVGAASAVLAKQITAEPSSLSEADVSRTAYKLSRPVIEAHLQELAELRPPAPLSDDYRRYIRTLALELELSGRIAMLIGEEGAEAELLEADARLADAAETATRFVHRQKLWGCAGTNGPRPAG
jgi:hypothetical protein